MTYKEEDLDQIFIQAEENDQPPPDPVKGIPKQWLPAWIRCSVKILVLPSILLDLTAQKIARKLIQPPYKQVGKCLKRGNCCHYILLPEPKGILGRLYYFYNTQINGFYSRFSEPHECEGKKIMVMGCRYLKKDGSCSNYHLRPTVCRTWPMIEYFARPRILKGCGFKAVPRKKGSSLDVLP